MPQNKNSVDTTVLLVEPDVLVRTTLAAYLRDCGYAVIEVGNGTEAINVLEDRRYAIKAMLTDADLPDTVDAFRLIQWTRTNLQKLGRSRLQAPTELRLSRGSCVTRAPC